MGGSVPKGVLATLAFGAVVAVLVAQGHGAATLPGDVTVADVECGTGGNVTALTATVTYGGATAVNATPHVWSARQHVQFSWEPYPVRLQPGSQTLRFEAPHENAVIYGDRAQLYLAAGQQRLVANFAVERVDGECRVADREGDA